MAPCEGRPSPEWPLRLDRDLTDDTPRKWNRYEPESRDLTLVLVLLPLAICNCPVHPVTQKDIHEDGVHPPPWNIAQGSRPGRGVHHMWLQMHASLLTVSAG